MPRRPRLGLAAAALLCWGLTGSALPGPLPGFAGRFVWSDHAPEFGGLSAIVLADDGLGMVALSDRGAFLAGRLQRDGDGRITGVKAGPLTALLADGAAPLRKWRNDSEGLARGPDGSFYVSFENAARVLRYSRMGAQAEPLPIAPDFYLFPQNAGLEALATDAAGTIFALPESTATRPQPGPGAQSAGDDGGPFPVYRYRNGIWDQPFSLPRRGPFVPAGADIGPDGRLYVLERAFHGLAGFSSQLRRYRITETALGAEEVLLTTEPGRHDNLEGISVWRDTTGDLRATLISDDNFNPIQRTEFVEYRLPD